MSRYRQLTTERLMAAVLFMLLFAMAVRVPTDTDTWWHLRSGEVMVEQHTILRHDLFSHTRLDAAWVNHSWGAQLALYGAYELFGDGVLPGDSGNVGLALLTAPDLAPFAPVTIDLPAGPLLVSGNPDKLELLFANLLNNAVRFTPECGEIHISAQKLGQEVWVTVQDNGIGIPAEELENIFKEFYQVENHLRRKHGGMGLGLAIARGIVRLHNGRIWAESSGENQGARICVVIPCCAEGDPSGPVFTGPGV